MKKLLVIIVLIMSAKLLAKEVPIMRCSVEGVEGLKEIVIKDNYKTGNRSNFAVNPEGEEFRHGIGMPEQTVGTYGVELEDLHPIFNSYRIYVYTDGVSFEAYNPNKIYHPSNSYTTYKLEKNHRYTPQANEWILDKLGDYSDDGDNSIECNVLKEY